MIFVGQQATWPKILFVQNRMTTERLIEDGLHLGDREQTGLGQDRRNNGDDGHLSQNSKLVDRSDLNGAGLVKRRRSSIMEEVKRQAGIFFDDPGAEGEITGESEFEEGS